MPSEIAAVIMSCAGGEREEVRGRQHVARGIALELAQATQLASGKQTKHWRRARTNQRMMLTAASGDRARAGRRPAPTVQLAAAAGPLLWLVVLLLQLSNAEAAMSLPDGIENILGFVPRSGFQCERDGYFGDIDNDCRLFHLCQRQVGPGGRVEWRHWTYACGNQTMFNQLTLTCAFVDEAIPCRHASQFQYLNEVIHKPAEPFLTDADVTSGFSYYSNRIMSDGARQRAFEDSQLLAQVGGGGGGNLLPASQPKNSLAATAAAPAQSRAQASGQFNSFTAALSGNQFATNQPTVGQNLAFQHWPAVHKHNQLATPARQQPSQDQAVDLIDNRHFHFHQQPTRSTSRNGPTQTDSNSASELHNTHEVAAIASASSNERPSSFAPTQTTTIATSSTSSPRNSQNSQFEYSITTNHQTNSASELANVIFKHQQPGDFNGQLSTAANVVPASTATERNQPSQFGPTTQTPPLVATFTSSHRMDRPQSQVTTLVTPATGRTTTTPTTTTTTSTTTTSAPRPQMQTTRRTSSSGRALRAGFQSSRLTKNQQKRQNQPQPTPIVMRRATNRVAAVSPPAETSQTSAWSTSGDFWRQSFDSQLMAPKFESLLLRRRV